MSTPVRSAKHPVVLVPSCNRMLGHHPYYIAGKKYVEAVRLAGCLALTVPSAPEIDVDELLDLADGVLLPGSPSNVNPSHFGEDVLDPSLPLDADRDGLTLPLIRRAIARGVPVMAICRGLQEVNVALGGSLHQAVHVLPEHQDHREDDTLSVDHQYGPAHPIAVQPGGLLARILGPGEVMVNSLHGQGVRQLAPGLRAEARAPDGLIEAFSTEDGASFLLAVQWHPEWKAAGNPVSQRIFAAFGAACQDYRDRHRPPSR